jgi:hypothetical protein
LPVRKGRKEKGKKGKKGINECVKGYGKSTDCRPDLTIANKSFCRHTELWGSSVFLPTMGDVKLNLFNISSPSTAVNGTIIVGTPAPGDIGEVRNLACVMIDLQREHIAYLGNEWF